ncbi:MAG: hypothetical protein IH588_12250 [Anaerolineales bacterium]|nr:hypothetical protein [Anaerolineales bacterium]
MKKKPFLDIFFLLVIPALVFLPKIGELIYFTDDWYYIYDGMVGGAKIFHEMFRIDRPARGYFFELYFSLFGPNPLPYHMGAFIWRALAAVGAFWIFNILWRSKRKYNFFAALLFAIYPGYFWWISAIEYQPMIASLAFQVFSIAFTLKAVQSGRRISKTLYLLGAILTGWIYIALVDYAIGMEVFRFLCVYVLVSRDTRRTTWSQLAHTLKVWAWNILIPAGIIFWRVFFFNNERKATDIGTQLGVFFERPLATGIIWFFQLYNSLLNISVLAWFNQFPAFFQVLRVRDMVIGLLLMSLVLLLVIFADYILKQSDEVHGDDAEPNRYKMEALLLGTLGMVFGALPIVLANRYINTVGFSHYGLPVSIASAVFLTAFVESLSLQRARSIVLYVVIAFAVLAHYGIAMKAATEEAALQKFWWQVSWRVPAIRAGTTLVINYPIAGMEGDGFGLMEAANVIYFPEPIDQVPVLYPLAGLTPNDQNIQDILDGSRYVPKQYRSHLVNFDYGNLLVISQPTLTSCVHVIDGDQPLISVSDPVNVALAAPSSRIDNVIMDAEPAIPPEYIYGSEPEHTWCYYFQKADFAAAQGDWERVIELSDEAAQLKLSPEDRAEWFPFLKAYAITGTSDQLSQTARRVVGDKFLRQQACDMLAAIQESLTPEVEQVIAVDYCKSAPE